MKILKITNEDKNEMLEMMRAFYNSPALAHKISDDVIMRDINDCLENSPYIEAYVFKENEKILGYTMLAKSYSTECGGVCVWIEDLYIKPEHQGKGIGKTVFEFVENLYKDKAVRFRLEVQKDNRNARSLYKKIGYKEVEYIGMTKKF